MRLDAVALLKAEERTGEVEERFIGLLQLLPAD
jgi:hypothetical protein